MAEEKIYVLSNGKKLVLMASKKIDEKRYLLLCEENTSDIKIAYEENRQLIFIEKDNKDFSKILIALVDIFKKTEDN